MTASHYSRIIPIWAELDCSFTPHGRYKALIDPGDEVGRVDGDVQCRKHLGGLVHPGRTLRFGPADNMILDAQSLARAEIRDAALMLANDDIDAVGLAQSDQAKS